MCLRRFLGALLCVIMGLFFAGNAALAQSLQPVAVSSIQSVRFNQEKQSLMVTSSQQLNPSIHYFKEQQANKIILDVPNSVFPMVHQEIQSQSRTIDKIRISQFQSKPPTVRMVLELRRPLEIAVRSRRLATGFETIIEPIQTQSSDPAQRVVGQQKLLNLRMSGQNLVLEGSAPVYPEIRRINKDRNDYLLNLYNFTTDLDSRMPLLSSSLIESISVQKDGRGVQIYLSLKRGDLELVPFSAEHNCTVQFLVKANEQNMARFTDLDIDELDQQTTRLRFYANKDYDYQIYPLENPKRLVIDTLGTVLGQSRLEDKLKSSQNIRDIRFTPTGPQNTDLRIVLDLHSEVIYQFDKRVGFLELVVQRKNLKPLLNEQNRRAFVVIDAGHGGNDPGALGVQKTREKDVSLAVSTFLQRYLENDQIQVAMTRSEDLEVLLQPRVDVANLRNADIFVSVHCNSMPPGNAHVRGLEAYYTTSESKELADILHGYLVKELGATDRRVRQRGLYVTRKTNMPSVLLEIGFLSNPEEEALLANPNYQRKVAKAIRDGIYDYLSRHKKLQTQL